MPDDVDLIIEGANIRDIPGFYAEINRAFMADEDWQLGETLDGLNDLLYGGFGALAGTSSPTILWRDFEASRAALGIRTTVAFLEARLRRSGHVQQCARFRPDRGAPERPRQNLFRHHSRHFRRSS